MSSGTKPDFEEPADADGDNVYKVTIVVTDNNGGRGEFDVCIEVTNVDEAGEITLVDDNGNEVTQPYAQAEITAVLTDEDGGVSVRDLGVGKVPVRDRSVTLTP